MPRTEQNNPSLTERILEAATRIVGMYTGLPGDDVRFVCDKIYRVVLAEFGIVGQVPLDTPDEVRFTMMNRGIALLTVELRQRKVDEQIIDELISDLDSFYRGVRNIAPKP